MATGGNDERVFKAMPAATAMPNPEDIAATRRHFLKSIEQSANNWLQEPIMATAAAVKVELDRVCRIIEAKTGCKYIDADTKSFASANRKINDECDGHWLDLKDAARGTLAANSMAELSGIVGVLKSILVHSEGYTLAKDEETTLTYPLDNKCGYSGFNFVVRFGMKPVSAKKATTTKHSVGSSQAKTIASLNGQTPAMTMTNAQVTAALALSNQAIKIPEYVGRMGEIQVNTYAMMYGKMDKKSFSDLFTTLKWDECFARTGIEGGFGHIFYEDWREDKESEVGKAIAALSTRYYARMRGTDPKPANGGDQLKDEVMAYITNRKPKAHS